MSNPKPPPAPKTSKTPKPPTSNDEAVAKLARACKLQERIASLKDDRAEVSRDLREAQKALDVLLGAKEDPRQGKLFDKAAKDAAEL